MIKALPPPCKPSAPVGDDDDDRPPTYSDDIYILTLFLVYHYFGEEPTTVGAFKFTEESARGWLAAIGFDKYAI